MSGKIRIVLNQHSIKCSHIKKIWTGWYDTYTDGLHEKYKSQDESGIVIVGSAKTTSTSHPSRGLFGITAYAGQKQASTKIAQSLKDRIFGLFCVNAYAKKSEQKNPVGEAFQVKGRINVSLDLNGATFTPQYYDPSRMTTFWGIFIRRPDGTYSGADCGYDKSVQCFDRSRIFPEFAAGACGNIWQESHFNPSDVSGSGYLGLVQWDGSSRGPK